MNEPSRLRAEIIDKLSRTFKSWRSDKPDGGFLRGLALVEQRIRGGQTAEAAVHATVEAALGQLEVHMKGHADLLRQRWGGARMSTVADISGWSESELYRKEKLAMGFLAEVLLEQERSISAQRQTRVRRALPPAPYTRLVGADAKLAQLTRLFEHSDAPWLIALVGMGGIGKTTLAYALSERLVTLARYDDVAWISAQQVVLSLDGSMELISDKPALTLETLVSELGRQLLGRSAEAWRVPAFEKEAEVLQHLAVYPLLVVVDNLETAADADRLIPFMRSARGPSKFILTSRVTPTREGEIFNYSVPPLTLAETSALIHSEAADRNLPTLLHCDEATAARIFEVTGGNPLAIRLVVGQIHLHGLTPVLDDLVHPRGTGMSLYRYLYDWVWHTLADPHRAVLRALMLLTEENSTASDIERLSGLSLATVQSVIEQLVRQNLVNLTGTLERRRYTLHNLTRAYLGEVIRSDSLGAPAIRRHE